MQQRNNLTTIQLYFALFAYRTTKKDGRVRFLFFSFNRHKTAFISFAIKLNNIKILGSNTSLICLLLFNLLRLILAPGKAQLWIQEHEVQVWSHQFSSSKDFHFAKKKLKRSNFLWKQNLFFFTEIPVTHLFSRIEQKQFLHKYRHFVFAAYWSNLRKKNSRVVGRSLSLHLLCFLWPVMVIASRVTGDVENLSFHFPIIKDAIHYILDF